MKVNNLIKFFGIFVFCLLLVISIPAQNATNFSESEGDLDENGTGEEILDEKVNENSEENESEEKEGNETSEEDFVEESNETGEIILEENESYEETNDSENSYLDVNESLEEDFENDSNESFSNESEEINKSEDKNNSLGKDEGNSNSGSGSSSNYIGIEEFDKNESEEEINSSNVSGENSKGEGKKERTHILQRDGKKEIEIKSFEEDIPKIMKEEFEKDGFSKEVRVSSDEHFDSPLRVYSSLKSEAKKEEIKIFWKNENREVTLDEFDVEYYDKNGNGLIDEVSWIVPHLSEQVFEIVVLPESTSENLLINFIEPSPENNSKIFQESVSFKVNLNYSEIENINCYLNITDVVNSSNNKSFEFSSFPEEFTTSLEDGNYSVMTTCFDEVGGKENSTKVSFELVSNKYEEFGIEGFNTVYLVQNGVFSESTLFAIKSPPNSNINVGVSNKSNGEIIFEENIGNQNNYQIEKKHISSPGKYILNVTDLSQGIPISVSEEFEVSIINYSYPEEIEVGEKVEFNVEIISPVKEILTVSLEYDQDKSNLTYYYDIPISKKHKFIEKFYHTYDEPGSYFPNLHFLLESGPNPGSISTALKVTEPEEENNSEETENEEDNEDPEIDLVFPEDGAVINKDNIEFKFKVNDSSKIDLCEFRLYNASYNSWSYTSEDLVYNDSKTNVQKNKDVKIPLTKFDERRYAWEVECIDEFENDYVEWGYFEVDFNASSTGDVDYEKKEVIESLISDANDFLDKEDDWSAEEKKALEDLGILSDLKTDKKNLVNIQKYFKGGENSVGTQDVKAKLKEDYLKDIEEIGKRMPAHFEIVDSYEFVKNSIDSDFESIIDDYLESTNTQISKSSKRKLSDFNSKLQQDISVSTEVKEIRIEYEDSEKTIMLVNKEVGISNDEYGRILEVIPKEIAESAEEINFVVESKVIKDDPIFEIFYEDLDDGEMAYFIEKSIDVEDFENTQTVLFEDKLADRGNGITGFLSLEFSGSSEPVTFIVFFLLAIVFIALVIFVGKKFRMYLWKKDPNVERATEYISDIKKAIKKNEIENAREIYYKLRKTYPVLPEKTKSYFYKEIKRVFGEIDKKDIFGMVKEYEEAKREFRKDDAVGLYKDIKKVYERLPKKYKEKVYERITK